MPINQGNLIGAGAPGNPWDVVEPGYFLPANWTTPVRVFTAWDTTIVPNQKDGESRRSRIGKPTRKVTASLLARDQYELSRVLGQMQQAGFARTLYPLYSDQVSPTQSYSDALVVSIQEDLDYYRFENGQYAVIYTPETRKFFYRQISTVNKIANTISFFQEVTGINRNTIILPLIQSRLQLRSSGRVVSDHVVSATTTGEELPGKWTLATSAAANITPPGFSEYNGTPVLELPPDYKADMQIRYARTGKYSPVGSTQIASVYGERMRQARDFSIIFDSRAEYWKLLNLFDSRAGRTYSWWLPSFTSEYEITEFTPSGIKVKSFGPVEDWEVRPYVSLTKLDGSVEIREISSVSTNDVVDTLIFDDGAFVEDDLSNVLRVGFAQHVRFSSDEIEEAWFTTDTVEVKVKAVELIEEKIITLADLTEITTVGATSKFVPVECDTDPVCDETCVTCANCWFSPSTVMSLAIAEVVADAEKNGFDSSFADYLTQNSPFDIPFSEIDNDYFIFRATIEQSPGRYMDVMLRYDCTLGLWQWEYTVDIGSGPKLYRACGNCLAGGGSAGVEGCSNFNGGSQNSFFIDDCWNHPRVDAGADRASWNLIDQENGCNGIAGWADHTDADYGTTGLAAGKTAIMWGVRGEWTVGQPIPCCQDYNGEDPPCIQCLNNCLIELNCIPDAVSSTTGCISYYLGLPSVTGAAVVTCGNCSVIITPTGGPPASCCDLTMNECPRVSVTMANNCLFDCDSGWDDICPRRVL